MSAGRHGFGTRVFFDGAEIRDVVDIVFEDATRTTSDATTYTTTGVAGEAVRRVKLGSAVVDGGGCTVTVLADPDNPVRFGVGGTPKSFVFRFPPEGQQIKGAEWATEAILTGIGRAVPMEDRMTQELRFDLSGPESVTPGSDTVSPAP